MSQRKGTTRRTSGQVTARHVKRRSPEEITKLAREYITGQVMVTNNPRIIESAFYMILAFVNMTKAATEKVGALIGDNSSVVPGRAMNGYPIYLSVGFLHKADIPAFDAEMERMRKALGYPEKEEDA